MLNENTARLTLAKLSPILGIISCSPAIIFSYDNFYSPTGLQSEMQEPKKAPLALVIGLAIVLIINIDVSIFLLLSSSNGRINEIYLLSNIHWLVPLMQFLITISLLVIINGTAIFSPFFYIELIKNNDLLFQIK